MIEVFLAIEIIIALFLVAVILMQRSEGGALGMGGGGSGVGGLMSARGAGNLLTRLTAVLAAAFIIVSLTLAVLTGNRGDGTSVFDETGAPIPAADDSLPSLDDPSLPANSDLPVLPDPDQGDDQAGEEDPADTPNQ